MQQQQQQYEVQGKLYPVQHDGLGYYVMVGHDPARGRLGQRIAVPAPTVAQAAEQPAQQEQQPESAEDLPEGQTRIELRIKSADLDQIDAHCAEKQISRSEFFARAVGKLLKVSALDITAI